MFFFLKMSHCFWNWSTFKIYRGKWRYNISVNKKKKIIKRFSMQISKLKGPSFHCQKFVNQKYLPCSRTFEGHYRRGWFFQVIFDNSNLKFGKMKKAKIKKYHFQRPVNRKPNVFITCIYHWKIRFCSYYAFSLNQIYVKIFLLVCSVFTLQ